MYSRKWKPSQSEAREFAQKMKEIDAFCEQNGISASRTQDSYYFTVNEVKYRVSNHSIRSSTYHEDNEPDVVHIHASKTRIMEIYNDLMAGYELDGHGKRKSTCVNRKE
jgi:hypothetical protein